MQFSIFQLTEAIKPVNPEAERTGCGYTNPKGVGFSTTGRLKGEVEFGEFPWMVAILLIENSAGNITKESYLCGGSLLAPKIVLTSVHNTFRLIPSELKVRAGEWDSNTDLEFLPHEERFVSEIIRHERFQFTSHVNDIAVLVMREAFEWREHIRPICLPPANTLFDNSRCLVTGWGKHIFGKAGIYQNILQKVEVPVVPHVTCQRNLRSTRLGSFFRLSSSFICAGGEQYKDACQGDGGSPLVCPMPGNSDRYYQAGIVSWGIGCGGVDVPGVYASVAEQRNWIDGVLSSRHLTAE